MKFKLPDEVKKIIAKFSQANFQIYIVGGAVRDLILNRGVKDWDFTTDAQPEEILKLFPNGYYNNQFGTIGLNSSLGTLEITTMREEGVYGDFRHPDQVKWTDHIEKDLKRRDFTINAMAFSPKEQLIDPFDALSDLQAGSIKAVGDPSDRFNEDALRLIRAIRLATELNFKIDEQTLNAISEKAQLLSQISWERIGDELLKILSSDNPYIGLTLLKETKLLEIILPELECCFGLIQEGPKHERVYDIGIHSFLSLKYCPAKDPIVRFATLIHDIGKPDTINVQKDGNVTFYGHDVVGAKLANKVAQRLKLSRKQTETVVNLVRWHMFTLDEKQTDSAIRRFIHNVGEENIDNMMALRIGDRLGGGTETAVSWRMKKFRERINQVLKQPFSVTDLKVRGQDVMDILKIKPSKKVGEVLSKLFQEVLDDPKKNEREYLIKRIKEVG